MAIPLPSLLRSIVAVSSLVLALLSGKAIYKSVVAADLVLKNLPLKGYVWVDILGLAGSGTPEKHVVNVSLEKASEIAVWTAAGCCLAAGLFGVLKVLGEAWTRRRSAAGKDYLLSRMLKALGYVAYALAVVAFVASAVSAVYVSRHRDEVRRSSCHWKMGEHRTTTLNCTRELAVCELSPYLVKPNRTEEDVRKRQKACGQLQSSREALIVFVLLSLVLVVTYGVQTYLARREEKLSSSVDEKIASVRSSSDSQSPSPRSSWGSSDGHRAEKAE